MHLHRLSLDWGKVESAWERSCSFDIPARLHGAKVVDEPQAWSRLEQNRDGRRADGKFKLPNGGRRGPWVRI